LGIPVVGISDGGYPGIRCRYEIDRQAAIAKIAAEWRKEAIRLVKVGIGARRSTADEERVGLMLRDLGLEVELVALGLENPERSIKSLDHQANSATMLLHSAASLLALRSPDALARLTSHGRVALVDGPVSVPLGHLSETVVDLVVVDWAAVAKQIVHDLLKHNLPDRANPLVFEATALFQVPLIKYAERL
jgi:hypothetical protein